MIVGRVPFAPAGDGDNARRQASRRRYETDVTPWSSRANVGCALLADAAMANLIVEDVMLVAGPVERPAAVGADVDEISQPGAKRVAQE
jgi:hypothetical protein